MNKSLKSLLSAVAFGLACHAPSTLAAYSSAGADALLTVTGSEYQLIDFEVTPSASNVSVGDALASADGDVLRQVDGLFVFGTVFADALFAPASAASANYSSVQPLLVQNTGGAPAVLGFSFDWSLFADAVNDFVAPIEHAQATVTVSLQQIANGVTAALFFESALATITDGGIANAGRFAFSYTLMPDELTIFLVGIEATGNAVTAVPLPMAVTLLAPALGFIAWRRREDRGRRARSNPGRSQR